MRGHQTSLDELAEGLRRRDAGMARASAAVDVAWRDQADAAIAWLARRGVEFSAEDVRAAVGDPPGHPNAFGPRFSSAAKSGLIRKVGYRPSTRPELHAHPICVWVGTEPSE